MSHWRPKQLFLYDDPGMDTETEREETSESGEQSENIEDEMSQSEDEDALTVIADEVVKSKRDDLDQ